MDNGLAKLKAIIKDSAFNQSPNYSVNASFKDLFKDGGGLLLYNEAVNTQLREHSLSSAQVVENLTPEFQRKNSKWTRAMQQCFIENLLCGCETKIQLYDVKGRGDDLNGSLILDGLQRLTAIASFHCGEFPVFDGLYWSDIRTGGVFPRLRLTINIYQFNSDIDACRFYIQMNKGITHSEGDLKTAYDFLEKYNK